MRRRQPLCVLWFLVVWVTAASGCDDTPTSTAPPAPPETNANAEVAPDEDVPPTPALDPLVALEQAGNLEDDAERYERLQVLREALQDSEALAQDLDRFLPVLAQWAFGRERFWKPGDQEQAGEDGYLNGFFALSVWPASFGTVYPPQVSEDSALYPIWCLLRGRMLIATAIENGIVPEQFFEEGRALLAVAAAAYPENRIPAMYLGTPIPWPDSFDSDPDAPVWAQAQRVALEKMADVIDYWLDVRQAPDGQFGGGWGDDVELWRQWTPVLLGFEDPRVVQAWTQLADGVFELPRLAEGYSDIFADVEHSAEDTGDTITPMLLLEVAPAIWRERALHLSERMEALWTATNERGFLQFKSTYFTATEVDAGAGHACDTNYHTRAIQPALLVWQREATAELTALFSSWLSTWVDAAEREEQGKPAGVIPSALHFPSGKAGGPGADWWNPGCHYSDATYRFPRALSPLLRSLVLAHWITGDQSFLAPLQSLAALRLQQVVEGTSGGEEGGALWAISKARGALADALAKHRLLTGDTAFDEVLTLDAGPMLRLYMTGEREGLEAALQQAAEAFSFDRAAFTSEVRFTDRLFKFHTRYLNAYLEAPRPRPDPTLIYSSVTGDVGDPLYLPLPAVRWQTTPRAIAALVTVNKVDHFEAELYHFSEAPRELSARLLRLPPGTYQWFLSAPNGATEEGEIVLSARPSTLTMSLPIRGLYALRVTPGP